MGRPNTPHHFRDCTTLVQHTWAVQRTRQRWGDPHHSPSGKSHEL